MAWPSLSLKPEGGFCTRIHAWQKLLLILTRLSKAVLIDPYLWIPAFAEMAHLAKRLLDNTCLVFCVSISREQVSEDRGITHCRQDRG
jgi:hypothetical protein